jgi:hypothetical protein
MNEELKSVLRVAMHAYAEQHGFTADRFDMSPEVRGRTPVLRWEIVGHQLRYEFRD